MPQFQVYLPTPTLRGAFRDDRDRNILQTMLNDEWSIIFVLNTVERPWIVNSIEIHRENTSEEFFLSGKFTGGTIYLPEIFEKKFSRIIEKGSSFITLLSNFNQANVANLYFSGVMNINEKQPTSLSNRESKDIVQMNSLEQLSKDIEHLLDPQSSCFCDFYLKCGSTSIPAHKLILSARSPVFAAMFAHPTQENLKNEVNITDIDASVLQAMLKYMYTGKTADLTLSSTADLLFAADKYQLLDLKAVCSYFLKETICPENVWKILVLGDTHDENLKSFAVDYICNKCGELSALQDSQEWKSLRKERPNLVIDLLESMVKYRDEKLNNTR